MKIKSLPIIAGVFIAVVMAVQFAISYYHETRNMMDKLDCELELAQQSFQFPLYDLHDAAEELRDAVVLSLNNPDDIREMTLWVLKQHPHIEGCYVNFAPNYYAKKGKYFCVSSFYKNDTINSGEFSGAEYDYFQREWYTGALECDENGYWSSSYRDADLNEMIFTHSLKVEKNGKTVGVIGLDFSIAWTKQLLETIKPSDHAVCRLYSSNGTQIAYVGENDRLSDEGNRQWIISRRTLFPMDVTLVIAVPKTEILSNVKWLNLFTLALMFLGLALLGWIVWRIWKSERQNEFMQGELRVANQIQLSMLPHGILHDKWLEAKGTMIPAREVGGDLYDYCVRGDDLFFLIGDVSGKGVPAAMFMSATVNLFRSAVQRLDSPRGIMEDMNTILSAHNPAMTFVTAFIGKIDLLSGQLIYCNAGHLPPVTQSGELIEVEPNIPLGYDGTYSFIEQCLPMPTDELLILYTDGITEARNTQHQMLGMKRWIEIVQKGGDLLKQVQAFMADTEQTDDITLLTILCKSTFKQTESKP